MVMITTTSWVFEEDSQIMHIRHLSLWPFTAPMSKKNNLINQMTQNRSLVKSLQNFEEFKIKTGFFLPSYVSHVNTTKLDIIWKTLSRNEVESWIKWDNSIHQLCPNLLNHRWFLLYLFPLLCFVSVYFLYLWPRVQVKGRGVQVQPLQGVVLGSQGTRQWRIHWNVLYEYPSQTERHDRSSVTLVMIVVIVNRVITLYASAEMSMTKFLLRIKWWKRLTCK